MQHNKTFQFSITTIINNKSGQIKKHREFNRYTSIQFYTKPQISREMFLEEKHISSSACFKRMETVLFLLSLLASLLPKLFPEINSRNSHQSSLARAGLAPLRPRAARRAHSRYMCTFEGHGEKDALKGDTRLFSFLFFFYIHRTAFCSSFFHLRG